MTGNPTSVLADASSALRRARTDAGGTRLRLRALHVMGHSPVPIARAAGASERTIRRLVRGDARTVSPQLRDAVAAIFDSWKDKRAPQRTPAQHAAASAARRCAATGNWCAGAALDDDQLDTAGYRPGPGSQPARKPGTTTDIQPASPRPNLELRA
jgi:hypothetical protein